MHIRKRDSGYRIDLCVNGIRKSLTYHPKATTPAAARKEAEQYAAECEDQLRHGLNLDLTFEQLINIWDENWLQVRVQSGDMTPRCREDYLHNLQYCKSIFRLQLNKITPLHLDSIVNELVKSKAPKTVRNIFVPVKGLFSYAYKKGLIEADPCPRMNPLPSAKKDEMHIWSEDDLRNFFDALEMTYYFKGHNKYTSYYYPYQLPLQWKVFFYLAVYSGCRRAELVALNWDCVDFDAGQIRIEKSISVSEAGETLKDPKTAAGNRQIGLPSVCFSMLRQLQLERKEALLKVGRLWSVSDPVFIQADGSRMNVMSPTKKFTKILRAYNKVANVPLPVIRLHDLRHTNASHLVAAGVDIETVARRLGHSRPSFTLDVYGHALPEQDSKAVEALEKLGVNLA